ncbi:hypothetical protein [Syntrophobacter fumaroxidans]|nr:hypothetical protein [Syntrophobacter fumaroxidans]
MERHRINVFVMIPLLLASLALLPLPGASGTARAQDDVFHPYAHEPCPDVDGAAAYHAAFPAGSPFGLNPGERGIQDHINARQQAADGMEGTFADSGFADRGPDDPAEGLSEGPAERIPADPLMVSPLSPAGTITDTTPTYKWTREAGATQYRYQLMKGTTTVYTRTVGSGACGASTCSNTPATVLGFATYKWRVRAMVNNVWKPYSAFKTFTVAKPIPTPMAPVGTITDRTPTYRWTKISGATQYQYQLVQGTTTVYTRTAGAGVCGASTCASTPSTALRYATYKWRVRAMVNDIWKPYSAFKTFTVEKPIPGCDAVLLPAHSGGCTFRLVTPQNCEEIDLSGGKYYEFAWFTDGVYCETPWTMCIAGNPANVTTGKNIYCEDFSAGSTDYITHYGGIVYVDAEAFNSLGLTTDNGIYHWVVISFSGANPNSQTFRVKQ